VNLIYLPLFQIVLIYLSLLLAFLDVFVFTILHIPATVVSKISASLFPYLLTQHRGTVVICW